MLPCFSYFPQRLGGTFCHFFIFLNPLAVRSAFSCLFAFHIPNHAGHARSRSQASVRRSEAPLVPK